VTKESAAKSRVVQEPRSRLKPQPRAERTRTFEQGTAQRLRQQVNRERQRGVQMRDECEY